ncbi:MAG TPA: site-specific integrase [Rubricoccaceae bacterium]|nr:site-specific integrase [Rubricoccaceae bacterium]
MASLFKDTRSGIYVVEFYDADRRPAERRVTTGVRDQRPADRLRRFWEAAYAEGRYDPWFGSPPLPGGDHDERARRRHLWPITLTEARTAFLTSRAHRAANTRASYDRVTGWFADHVGGDILIAKVSVADIEGWLGTLDVKPVTVANYVRHLRAFLTVACTDSLTTKSGAERRIPLSQRAREVLCRLQRERESVTGRVFESGGRGIDPHTCSDTVKRYAVKAGVPRLTPHVLRHTAITRLIERGVPVPIVQRFAGHADVSTTMRFCSIADDVYADRIVSALGS